MLITIRAFYFCGNSSFSDSGSPAFEEFLQFLGERVELQGWDKFRAGLDVTSTFRKIFFLEPKIYLKFLFYFFIGVFD
jgi:hypothetical protein